MTKPKQILIIEDNPDFLMLLKERLEMNGYETITAQNGLKGLSAVKEKNPDLILLDLMLPEIDGHKLCRMIKFDKRFKEIPVIILTSRDTSDDAELAKKYRADAFIVKTTRKGILLDVIKKLLER